MLFKTPFSETDIVQYVNQTAAFIKTQKDLFFSQAQPLSEVEQETFKPFFSEPILKTTRFYRKADGPIETPDFIRELQDRGVVFSFDQLLAVTFVDAVVAIGELDAQVQFHELVHAVQYQKLGLKQFANKYVRGLLTRG